MATNYSNEFDEVSSTDPDLYKEYVQWYFIIDKLYQNCHDQMNIRDGRNRNECITTLHRWMMFVNQGFADVPKYEYYPILPNVKFDHHAAQYFKMQIIKKRFVNEVEADEVTENILTFISSNHEKVDPPDSTRPLIIKRHGKSISIERFKSKDITQLESMIERTDLTKTARMILRYESLGVGSYQWMFTDDVYQFMEKEFNVSYTGFATPLSRKYDEIRDRKNETYYFSLFPETDNVFGSLGDFFNADFSVYEGGWYLSVPFIEEMMERMVDKILQFLDKDDRCWFFCNFPDWNKNESWKRLKQSSHLIHEISMGPRSSKQMKLYGERPFRPVNSKIMFVLGKRVPNQNKLKELSRILVT